MQRLSAHQLSNWADAVAPPENGVEERDLGSYSTLVTRAGAVMLDFRMRNGESRALPYSYLTETRFNPAGEILLRFVNHEVRLLGRNLRSLYELLLLHRVTWIRATSEGSVAENEPEVVSIAVSEL